MGYDHFQLHLCDSTNVMWTKVDKMDKMLLGTDLLILMKLNFGVGTPNSHGNYT